MGMFRRLGGLTLTTFAGGGAAFGAWHAATVVDRKTASEIEHPLAPSDPLSRNFVTLFVCAFGKLYSRVALSVRVANVDTFREEWALGPRGRGRGLLTLCNHTSMIDEPIIVPNALLGVRECVYPEDNLMWSATAADVMFRSAALSWLSSNAQAMPIVRGGGIVQRGVHELVRHLDEHRWVNYYPEGRVHQNADGTLGPLKLGFTELVLGPKTPPLIVPILSDGMDASKPLGKRPVVGVKVHVWIGDPIDVAPLVADLRARGSTDTEIRSELVKHVDSAMARERERAAKWAVGDDTPAWWERASRLLSFSSSKE